MNLKFTSVAFGLFFLCTDPVMADTFWRNVMTTGATSASTYLTSKDNKLVVAAQDDASSFVGSDGKIRGSYLESALREVRAENPNLKASDMDLANAILTKNALPDR